ncbi:MCE family protein [Actinomadura algeriensis]|uniref:Phospholipid/cholesterol/gamma-HCH transport system substrate-binding protein n=1 Tax=Actinomadura algeriensis TaxID=1679523 RepID=A0ABR9K397_9ACTN|nr:MCE family protein [Actinomadura algeriensis]MBE1537339.1 phospholipid/cholesterol/gamma-HCH transport system substrate-binding protein [Actinomadura algeriensis]
MSDEHPPGRDRVRYALAGFTVLAAAVAAVVVGVSPRTGDLHRFDAVFPAAGQGLDPGKSDVKVRGVEVGRVESLRLRPDGRVVVGFRVAADVAVPAGTRAAIEPASFFGPKDLTLELGDGPALPDGARIRRTVGPREPGDAARPAAELATAIDPGDVAAILHTLGAGLDGRGPALRRTVRNGAELADVLHARTPEIERLIRDVAGVSGVLGERGDTVAGAAGDFNRLAPSLYGRPDRVSRLLDETAELADRTAGALRRSGAGLGRIIDGTGAAVGVVAGREADLPRLIEVLERLFRGLSGMIRIPGPEGTLLGAGYAEFPLDPCAIVIDLCEP